MISGFDLRPKCSSHADLSRFGPCWSLDCKATSRFLMEKSASTPTNTFIRPKGILLINILMIQTAESGTQVKYTPRKTLSQLLPFTLV